MRVRLKMICPLMRTHSDFDKGSVFTPHSRLFPLHDGKAQRIGSRVTGKTILIGLGGTGARVVEAAVMLSAAGVGPSTLSVLLLDSDGAHGNGERTAHILTRYHRFRHLWSGGAHGVDYSAGDAPCFGGIAVEPLLSRGQWQWSPPPVASCLSSIARGVSQPLLNSLFLPNATEAGRQVQHGMAGRAHLGAALFGGMFADPAHPPTHPIVRSLKEALADGARIVMVGSGFGGTGVGAMAALFRALRGAVKTGGTIAGMLVPPYFDYGEDVQELIIRTRLARQSLRGLGLNLLPVTVDGFVSLPNHGRSGRAQCNPSMPQELGAAAGLLAFLMGEEETPILPSGHRGLLHDLIRFCHFNLYETQVRLRAKAGLFSGNWAMGLAGKVDPAHIGEPVNLLADISRRILEWAGSIETISESGAPNLGWHIAPVARTHMPITDAPRQGVQMIHPSSLSQAQIATAFDHLLPHGSQYYGFSAVMHRLKRKPPVSATHKGMGRVLVAVHAALANGGA